MFDAIAPRYDLVNRVMTFRMDVGWRRRTVRSLRLGPGSVVGDLACGTGDLCRELHDQDLRPARVRPVVRDARRRPHRGAAGPGRHPPPAAPRRVARRRHLRLRPAQPGRARGVLRRAGAGWSARAGASPCWRSPSRPTRCCAGVTRLYFGKVVPTVGGLLSDAAAYRYLPRSVAYLPPPGTMLAPARGRRVRRGRADPAVHGDRPAVTATRPKPGW